MTEVTPQQEAKPARRLPVSAPVLWIGVPLGAFLATAALSHGIMLPLLGAAPLAAYVDAILTFVLLLFAGVVLAELTRRHHRAAFRHGWRYGKRGAIVAAGHAHRHGKRGASAAYRGARRHGGRGAGFAAGQAKARWAAWRGVEYVSADNPVPLSEEWGVPPAAPPPPDQPAKSTGGTTMTGNGTKPAPRGRRTAITAVPGGWGAVVAHTADFQAESDGDLLSWMRGEAIGAAAYAEALVEQHETCRDVIGVDPVAIQTLHDVADAAVEMAATMAAAVKRFAEHYELPTQFVSDGGLLAHDGRWHKGDAD